MHRSQTLFIVRHVHSSINAEGCSHLTFDPPVSELGRVQLRRLESLVDVMDPHLVVVSPLSRALETAVHLFQCYIPDGHNDFVPIVVTDNAREVNGGAEFIAEHRRSASEIEHLFPGVSTAGLREANNDIKEHLVDLRRRALNLLKDICQSDAERVVVVSHFHIMAEFLRLFPISPSVQGIDLKNGGVIRIRLDRDGTHGVGFRSVAVEPL